MARDEFKGWPDFADKPEKPFDRLLPFHRINTPKNHIVIPRNAPAQRPFISGDGYGAGARSTKDYDGKFGEKIGKEVGKLISKLTGVGLITGAIAAALRKFGLEGLAKVLDDFDPFVLLFGFIGSRLDALLVDGFIRSIPAWVPTFDERLHPDIQLLEVDGVLRLSHQNYDSIPFWQWHRWYDWRFVVEPSPLFIETVGLGNLHRNDDNAELERKHKENSKDQFQFVPYHHEGFSVDNAQSSPSLIDCVWDIGALGIPPGPFFFDFQTGRANDWCWPMPGMSFWGIGRSVYDCSHATADNARRTNRPDRKPVGNRLDDDELLKRGVHLNELHPLKAMATTRWEAFQFKENPKPVPAIQFMFYADNRLGSAGFFRKKQPGESDAEVKGKGGLRAINDENYEFIVDLPLADLTIKPEYAIGHTPDFALNTLVLTPRLVIHPEFKPFESVDGVFEDEDDRLKNFTRETKTGPEPTVALIDPKPGEQPRQARVTIPLKDLSGNFGSYGVLLSIGWLDPDATQAPRVKKVTVTLTALQVAGDLHEDVLGGDSEYVMNFGVNGRWFQFVFVVKRKGERFEFAKLAGRALVVEMLLADDDFVVVSAHGMEEDPLGVVMRKEPEYRPPKKRPEKNPQTPQNPKDASDQATAAFQALFFADRILRLSRDVTVPSGDTPTPENPTATTTIDLPLVGKEIEWDVEIDTDDDAVASQVARAMFLRVASTNALDANDLLGMIHPQMRDPTRKNPTISRRRSQDITDSPNPLVVGDVLKEVGAGGTKKCELSAYATSAIGRMGTLAYDPQVLDYKLFFDVKVEELPADPPAG